MKFSFTKMQGCANDYIYLDCRTSVVPENMSCDALSERLGAAGIAVRSGLHCAPLAHDTADTLQTGTVRLSVSPFNTPREIDRAADVIENILKNSYKL